MVSRIGTLSFQPNAELDSNMESSIVVGQNAKLGSRQEAGTESDMDDF